MNWLKLQDEICVKQFFCDQCVHVFIYCILKFNIVDNNNCYSIHPDILHHSLCVCFLSVVLPAGLQSVHLLCRLRTLHSRDCYLIYSRWVNRRFAHEETILNILEKSDRFLHSLSSIFIAVKRPVAWLLPWFWVNQPLQEAKVQTYYSLTNTTNSTELLGTVPFKTET